MTNPPMTQDFPWRRNLVFATIGVTIAGIGFSLVTPFLPFYLEELGVKQNLALWTGIALAAASLTYSLMAPVWGTMADRYGKRVMFLRSGFGIALTYLVMAFCRTPLQFVLARLANGILSGFIPSCIMLVACNTPAAEMGFALGVVQTASAVGSIFGPMVGGVLARLFGIRYTFIYAAGFLMCAAVVTFLGTREAVTRREDAPGVIAGLRASFSRRDLRRLFLAMFAVQTALMAVQPTLPILVRNLTRYLAQRETALVAGVIFSLTGISTALGAPLVGRIKGYDYRRLLGAGLIIATILGIMQGLTGQIYLLGLERFVFGFANAAVIVSGNVLIAQSSPENMRGQVFGVLNAVSSLGAILGPILGGYVAGWLGIPSSFFLSGLLFAAALPLVQPGRKHGSAEAA